MKLHLLIMKTTILDENIEDNNLENSSVNTMSRSRTERKSLLITFLDSLAKMESHYCRASTSKLYLEPIWHTKKALYDFYCKDFCEHHNTTPMSTTIFDLTLELLEEKNISLFRPKKDAYDMCTAFETGNLSTEEKTLLDQMKIEARYEKETDKESIHEVYKYM